MGYNDKIKSERDLIDFTGNLDRQLPDLHAQLGISAERAAEYATTRADFMGAYEVYHTAETHSTPYRVAKDEAKGRLLRSTRALCEMARADEAVSAEALAKIGVRRRDRRGTPASRPTAAPLLTARAVGPTTLEVLLADAADPSRRGKPEDVRQAAVVAYAGETPPSDAASWGQPTLSGTTRVRVSTGERGATTVWVTAWWINTRNVAGPAAAPVPVRVAGTSGATPAAKAGGDESAMKIAA